MSDTTPPHDHVAGEPAAPRTAPSFGDVAAGTRGTVTPPLPGAPRSELVLGGSILAFGIVFDLLTTDRGVGLGFTLALLVLAGLVGALHGRYGLALAGRERWWFLAAAAALTTTFTLLDSPAVHATAAFALLVAAVMLSVRVAARQLRHLRLSQFLLACVELPMISGLRVFELVGRLARSSDASSDDLDDDADGGSRSGPFAGHGRDIVIGVLIALPLLGVFTALLAAADAEFARIVGQLLDWDIDAAIVHLLTISLAALGAGTIVIAALASVPQGASEPRDASWAGAAVVWIVLGSLVALFAAFCALQAGYLFGGSRYLGDASGLTAAEYARRGFFELLVVAALVVPLLLVVRAWHADTTSAHRAFRVTAPALASFTILLQGSAFARMWMYQDRFGLTEQRLWATLLLAWIATALAWYAVRVALARSPELTAFAASSGLVLVLGLVASNPIGIVAATNMSRSSNARVDTQYLATLGADSVPAIVQRLDEVDDAVRRRIAADLLDAHPYSRDDWRLWNASRHRADAAIDEHREDLERAAHD